MEHPLVSICIANYNGESILADCIGSVRAQKAYADCEIIVHDDASSDASVELIRTRFPDVRLIVSDRNVGFCVANNRMVDVANGQYILLLNNDAALLPDAIESLLEAANASGREDILTLPQFDWKSGALVDRGCFLDPFYNAVPNQSPTVNDVGYVIGACLWIPRSLWQRIGGFPEWMGSIGEDVYICCVARLLGHRVTALNTSGYRHRQGYSFGGNKIGRNGLRSSYRRRYLSEKNRLCLQFCCTPTLAAWPLLGVHVLTLVFEAIALCALARSFRAWNEIYSPALRAYFELRPELTKLRKHLQSRRRLGLWKYLRMFTWLPQKLRLGFRHGMPTLHD